MPYKMKKDGSLYCVYEPDGTKVKCYNVRSKAMALVRASYVFSEKDEKEKLESYAEISGTHWKYDDDFNRSGGDMVESEVFKLVTEQFLENITLENGGPVILGIAATNRPHLPLPPMSVVEKDGEKFVRVPFLRKGVFRHPRGNLIFNDAVMDKMLDNYQNKRSHYGVSLDLRHDPKLGAWAWFDRNGGHITSENDPEFGRLLVAYGKPTSEKALDMVRSGMYQYASIEFDPNRKDTLMEKLSADDLVEISLEDITQQTIKEKVIVETIAFRNPFKGYV